MITLTVGISNSGKTTWAEKQEATNINRDDIRLMLFCEDSLSQYKFTKVRENKVTAMQFQLASSAISYGHDIIISDTNLNKGTRDKWEVFAKEHNQTLELKEFDIEPHVAKARNIKRDYSIPPSAIDRQYIAWRKYKGLKQASPHNSFLGYDTIIYDMDGTLADMTGIRGPFEWSRVHLDTPRKFVVEHARMMSNSGHLIVIMSGRDGSSEELTRKWLKAHGVPFDGLFMRGTGDSRPDAVIKEELYFKHVHENFNVKYVVDDRDQMVARWRAMGLECWQVQSGDF